MESEVIKVLFGTAAKLFYTGYSIFFLWCLYNVYQDKFKNPSHKIIWFLAILLIPVVGCVAYLLIVKKQPLPILALVLLGMVCFAYSDHFHNPFQFDDNHTILSNMYIRDIKNIPKFFTDATTTSSLPANQAYRPGLTTLNAIDYWLSGEKGDPQPLWFHISTFISFLILGIFIYLFSLKIFNLTYRHPLNPFIALLVTAVFLLHTGNAETITYIISRTDSFSTLMMMVALCLFAYQRPPGRYWWYFIPMTFGFLVKEPAVMVGPLAFLFMLLFEEQISLPEAFKKYRVTWNVFKKFIPAFLLAVVLFVISKVMTPKTWTSGNDQYLTYWMTQTFVVIHYVVDYFFPFNLSADTDWSLIHDWHDDRVIVGVVFIISTLWLAFHFSKKRETRPVTFGILWFYICLFPTSVQPFAEVLNDHRVFLPYIGLTIGVVWGLFTLYLNDEKVFFKNLSIALVVIPPLILIYNLGIKILAIAAGSITAGVLGLLFYFINRNTLVMKGITVLLIGAFLIAHMFGVRERCKVWSTGTTLWADVVAKSPHNGRGLMNYGNALMGQGDYKGALEYFNKAKQEWPYYSYIYTNLGVLYSAEGNPQEAEKNFLYARQLNSQNPEFYYFYSDFLKKQKRYSEALQMANTGLALSPQHPGLNFMKNSLLTNPQVTVNEQDRVQTAEKQAKENPSPESWLNLSLVYYNAQRYQDCVNAAQEALKLRPDYDLAYNNICSAYNVLHEWDKAIEAGKRAVQISPNNQLAKNNLQAALNGKNGK